MIITTEDIIKNFKLELVSGVKGIQRPIIESDLYRPGIELAGFFDYYPASRIQIIGNTELAFYQSLTNQDKHRRIEKLCTQDTPCIIITRNLEVPKELIQLSEKNNVPILKTAMKTTLFLSRLTNYLEIKLAPMINLHGVLIDVYGVGVLITGKSGVGKSETALELIKRGHRLVADDCVEIFQQDTLLIGQAPELIQHLLEIRGLGILNVMTMFGAGAVRSAKQISLVINLEAWNQEKHYDRLGLDEEFMKIIDVSLPKLTIPVQPGRNLAIIVEAGTMNFRLKTMGIHSAKLFTEKLSEAMDD